MKEWIALNVHIPQEFQEAVSNYLMEQGATGIEEIEEVKERSLQAYFLKDGKEEQVAHALRRYLRSLQRLSSQKESFSVDTSLVSEQDWGENWKRHFKSIRVGSRIVVFPPWEKVRLKRGQIPVEIFPGMAFGTGTHATTQLCIRVLEKRVQWKGLSVLDVGTGSGILAIVAAKLGAREVRAIDIDPVAIEGARENAERNGVQGIVRVRRGGIGRIRKAFDVVVANVDFKGLMRMKMALLGHLKDDGFLILSGILREQEEQIRGSYLETRVLRLMKADHQEEWACLTFKRKGKQ